MVLLLLVLIATSWWESGARAVLEEGSVRLGLVAVFVVVFTVATEGLYSRVQARRWPATTVVVGRAVIGGVAAFSLAAFLLDIDGSRRWLLVLALGWTGSLALHHGLRSTRSGGAARSRVIIAGSPRAAVSMRLALRADSGHAYEVVGFVVDRLSDDLPPVVASMALGSVDDLPHLIERYAVDQVVFCLSGLDGDRFEPMTRLLNRAGVHVALTGLGAIAPRRVGVSRVRGRPIVYIAPAIRFGWPLAVKRAVDIVVASILLVGLAPLLLLVTLAIRLIDRQPPIFRQRRVGKGGALFTIYKFRTMAIDTGEAVLDLRSDHEGPVFKMTGDPRITRFGRLLRKASIDELPQLWNVLRGEMSLVGPRPLIPSEVAAAPDSFRDRELVTPGMTGRWQVSGRSDTEFEELDELDRWYVDNWSLSEDLEILARTVPAVLFARGAR